MVRLGLFLFGVLRMLVCGIEVGRLELFRVVIQQLDVPRILTLRTFTRQIPRNPR
jgi:hypothetical protein